MMTEVSSLGKLFIKFLIEGMLALNNGPLSALLQSFFCLFFEWPCLFSLTPSLIRCHSHLFNPLQCNFREQDLSRWSPKTSLSFRCDKRLLSANDHVFRWTILNHAVLTAPAMLCCGALWVRDFLRLVFTEGNIDMRATLCWKRLKKGHLQENDKFQNKTKYP